MEACKQASKQALLPPAAKTHNPNYATLRWLTCSLTGETFSTMERQNKEPAARTERQVILMLPTAFACFRNQFLKAKG